MTDSDLKFPTAAEMQRGFDEELTNEQQRFLEQVLSEFRQRRTSSVTVGTKRAYPAAEALLRRRGYTVKFYSDQRDGCGYTVSTKPS